MRPVYLCAADYGSVLQHVFQVNKVAVVHVLGKIVSVVEVDKALVVGGGNVFVQEEAAGNVFAYFPGHVIALY